MITDIKTKDLLKLYDPTKDGIEINSHKFTLDLNKLSKLVSQPNNELFNKSDDIEINFYNNLALYIINFEDKNQHIELDLEKDNPSQIIQQGLEHFIAVQYLKKPTIFVGIKENTTGLQFIKNKKLSETEQPTTPFQTSTQLKDISFEDQIVVDNFFAWVHGEQDIEKDKSFYLKSLIECINTNRKKDNNEINKELQKISEIYTQIPQEISSDIKFKEEIFNHPQLSTVFFELFGTGKKFLDFSSSEIKDLIFKDVEAGNMKWVKLIYSENRTYRSQQLAQNIDYLSELYNHPKVVQALTDGTLKSYSSWSSNEFNIRNIYSSLKEEYQKDKKIIFAYLEACEADHRGSEKWIMDSELFKIPLSSLKDINILKRVAYTMDWQSLKSRFLKSEEPTLKLEKDFILEVAKDLSPHKFQGLIETFYRKESSNFDDEFKKECLRRNSRLYECKLFNSMFNDMNFLIFLTEELNIPKNKIEFSCVRNSLFKDNLSQKEQVFLETYMIETKKNLSKPSELDIPKEFHEEYRTKYQKLEYCFYKTDSWSAWRDDAVKRLKKIKNEDELIDIFTKSFKYSYVIDAPSMFSGINQDLKSNPKVIFSFLENIGTNVDLRQCGNFLFNKNNCIKLLDFGADLRVYIPEPMYYDKDFSLALADKLDKNANFDNIPVKVKKFFEQKEVDQNYHSFLKSFISYNEMIKKVDTDKPITEVKKKMKI